MTKITAGTRVEIHAAYNYESNCAICAKPLGVNPKELRLGDGDVLLTASEYAKRADRNEFVSTVVIGNSCVKKFDLEVVA